MSLISCSNLSPVLQKYSVTYLLLGSVSIWYMDRNPSVFLNLSLHSRILWYRKELGILGRNQEPDRCNGVLIQQRNGGAHWDCFMPLLYFKMLYQNASNITKYPGTWIMFIVYATKTNIVPQISHLLHVCVQSQWSNT